MAKGNQMSINTCTLMINKYSILEKFEKNNNLIIIFYNNIAYN